MRGPTDTRLRRSAFALGFRQRSPLVLVVAAGLLLAGLLAVQLGLENNGLADLPEGRLLRITHDDYVHVAWRMAQLRRQPPSTYPVYLFGGSGTMDSFVDERSLGGAVTRDAGRGVQIVSLAAHSQSMAFTLALVDNLPRRPSMLAIGLAPTRFLTSPAEDERLLNGRPVLIQSARLEQLASLWYGGSDRFMGLLPGVFDYVGSYVKARVLSGETDSLSYLTHYSPPGAAGATPLEKRLGVLRAMEEDAGLYRLYGGYNFMVLEEILKLARERGYPVMLYDQPLNTSAAGPYWGGVVPSYTARTLALARRYGVPYARIQQRVELRDGDFGDIWHLLVKGRHKWQPEFARELARALGQSSGS